MSIENTQTSTNRSREVPPWTKAEIEIFVAWLEENQAISTGKQAEWIRKLKEEAFRDNHGYKHITMEKIKTKFKNMKRSYIKVKRMQTASGFGLREIDCE
jgi:hypothetical protein